jgi:hypothetical protein
MQTSLVREWKTQAFEFLDICFKRKQENGLNEIIKYILLDGFRIIFEHMIFASRSKISLTRIDGCAIFIGSERHPCFCSNINIDIDEKSMDIIMNTDKILEFSYELMECEINKYRNKITIELNDYEKNIIEYHKSSCLEEEEKEEESEEEIVERKKQEIITRYTKYRDENVDSKRMNKSNLYSDLVRLYDLKEVRYDKDILKIKNKPELLVLIYAELD